MMHRKKSLSLIVCALLSALPASAEWWSDFFKQAKLLNVLYQSNISILVGNIKPTDAYFDQQDAIREALIKSMLKFSSVNSLSAQDFIAIKNSGIDLYKNCYNVNTFNINMGSTGAVFSFLSAFLSNHYEKMKIEDQKAVWQSIAQSSVLGSQEPLYKKLYADYKLWLKNPAVPSSINDTECKYIDGVVAKFKLATQSALEKSSGLCVALGQSLSYHALITQIMLLAENKDALVSRYKIVPYSKSHTSPLLKIFPNKQVNSNWLNFLKTLNTTVADSSSSSNLEKKLFNEIIHPQQISNDNQSLILCDQLEGADSIQSFLSFLPKSTKYSLVLQTLDEKLPFFTHVPHKLQSAKAFLQKNPATIFNTITATVINDPVLNNIHSTMIADVRETYRMVPPMGPGHWLFGISVPFEPSQNAKNLLFSFLRWKGVK